MIVGVHAELRSRGVAEPRLPEPPPPDPEAAIAARDRSRRRVPGRAGGEERQADRGRARAAGAGAGAALGAARPARARRAARARHRQHGRRRSPPTARRSRRRSRRAAEAGEGGVAYGHLAELLALFSARFEAAKERRAGIDFEDLQILAARLLERAEIGEHYRSRFRQILVDEFQDTNRLQLRLIEALRGPKTELVAVGDELQSIYGFRHADLDVFRRRREEVERRARRRADAR